MHGCDTIIALLHVQGHQGLQRQIEGKSKLALTAPICGDAPDWRRGAPIDAKPHDRKTTRRTGARRVVVTNILLPHRHHFPFDICKHYAVSDR